MATIAVRVPTVVPGVDQLPGGQCYLLFDQVRVTLRELIAAKVQGELRKARAGGALTTSLPLLLPAGATIGFTPLDEQLAIAQACHAFVSGNYLIVCNGQPFVDLTEPLALRPAHQTGLYRSVGHRPIRHCRATGRCCLT